jgi:hypothetical protein
VAERCHSKLGRGFPSLGRSPRTEAFVAGARKRHYVRLARALTPRSSPVTRAEFPP